MGLRAGTFGGGSGNNSGGTVDVLGTVLTGLGAGALEPLADTDTILEAFEKIQAQIGALYISLNTTIAVTAPEASVVPLTVKGAASQSANLQEWKNNADSIKARVNSSGEFYPTKRIQFQDYGDIEFGNLDENGNFIFKHNSGKAVIVRDNASIVNLQVDSSSSSTDTALLIRGDGALRRVKMDTAAGGKRMLYVDE